MYYVEWHPSMIPIMLKGERIHKHIRLCAGKIPQEESLSNRSQMNSIISNTHNTKYDPKLKINFHLFEKLLFVDWKGFFQRNEVVGVSK